MLTHRGRWTERLVAGCRIAVRVILWIDLILLVAFSAWFLVHFLDHFREYLLRTIFGQSW